MLLIQSKHFCFTVFYIFLFNGYTVWLICNIIQNTYITKDYTNYIVTFLQCWLYFFSEAINFYFSKKEDGTFFQINKYVCITSKCLDEILSYLILTESLTQAVLLLWRGWVNLSRVVKFWSHQFSTFLKIYMFNRNFYFLPKCLL